jgi:uncharacterized phage protein gp47/JayE
MTFIKKSYSEITDRILSHLTKGIILREKHDYVIGRISYKLENDALDIESIEGTVKGDLLLFEKDKDYKLDNNMVEWLLKGKKPDNHTEFFVNYRVKSPQLITDVYPGSVIRTMVESVAFEIGYLYDQMDQIYNSGFIDNATGKSLDLVVSLLGKTRNKAEPATGEVIFSRDSEPRGIEVEREIHDYDGKQKFVLKNQMVKSIKKVDGTSGGKQTNFIRDKDFTVFDDTIVWLDGGKTPDHGSQFYVDYTVYEHIIVPAGTKISTDPKKQKDIKVFRTNDKAILMKKESRWEVEVHVEAMHPGKEGNVNAGALTIMPKSLAGIEKVINKENILNGTEAETDDKLRERAKLALEMAAKASLVSLKSAVQSVPGVTGNVKVVDQPDGIPGIVEIIASGGDEKRIKQVIEETRSAGIYVEFKRPKPVPLDINLTIVFVENVDSNDVKKEVDKMVRQYLDTLSINDNVILSHIIKSALGVQGVKDLRDVTINGRKENVVVRSDQKGELRSLDISMGD